MFDLSVADRVCTRLGLMIAAVIFFTDQVTKSYILYVVKLPEIIFVPISSIFNLTMVWNRGVSFGLLSGHTDWTRWGLVCLSAAISALLMYWLIKTDRKLNAVAFGLIIGGAIGNIVDRILYGAVADFLDFSGLWFPYVFNVADAAITLGVLTLIYDGLRGDTAQKHNNGSSHAG